MLQSLLFFALLGMWDCRIDYTLSQTGHLFSSPASDPIN